MESWREELYHYGILGMKWGVRRYQNPDGSLTASGRKRYAKDLKKANRLDDLKSISNSGRRNYSRKAAKAQIKANKAQTNLSKLKSKEAKLQNKSDALTSKYKSQESNFHLGKARQTYEQKLKVDAKLSKMQSKVAKGEAKANAALANLSKQENGKLEFKSAAQKYAAKGEILTEKMIKKYGLTKTEIDQDKANLKAGKSVERLKDTSNKEKVKSMVDEYNANKSDYDNIAKDQAKERREIEKAEKSAAKSNHEYATGVANIMKTNHVDYDTAVKMYEEKKRRR